ncbi:hypothetical protein GBA52_015649 [Prunus armeniaca]|nr:hypothetical protein GBA52_015649 [Prunus armeniaca]
MVSDRFLRELWPAVSPSSGHQSGRVRGDGAFICSSPKLIRDGETRSWWTLGLLSGFSLWTLTAAIEGSNMLVSEVI